jgi:hypothetical protein
MKKETLIVKSKLISERQWTESLIKKYLPIPDKECSNPHYRNGPEMKLYFIDRILKIEKGVQFQKDFENTTIRKNSAARSIITKTNNLLEYATTVVISLERIPTGKLKELAISHYETLWARRHFYKTVSDPTPEFLNRITVNYLRHSVSCYEQKLLKIKGKTGKEKALEIIREKVYDKISECYPFLKDECLDQMESRR